MRHYKEPSSRLQRISHKRRKINITFLFSYSDVSESLSELENLDFSQSSLPEATTTGEFLQMVLEQLYPNIVDIFRNGELKLNYVTWNPSYISNVSVANSTLTLQLKNSGGATDAGIIFNKNLSSLIGKNKKVYITGRVSASSRALNVFGMSNYSASANSDASHHKWDVITSTSTTTVSFDLDSIIDNDFPYLYIGIRTSDTVNYAYITSIYIE